MSDEGAAPQPAAARARRALVLVETGTPEKPAEARAWLTRVYSDPVVMDTPFGADYQRLFSSVIAFYRARKLEAALESVGGGVGEGEALRDLAAAVCERLGAEEGGEWLPSVAFRHGSPSMADAVRTAREAGCTRVIFVFARPFASAAGSGSAAAELRQLAAESDVPELSLIDRFDAEPGVRAAFAAVLRDAFATLPEDTRQGAELLFTLRGQPVPGEKRDPALESAQTFVEAVKAAAGVENASSLAFQCQTDPRADFAPSVEDALERLATEQKQAVVVVPLTHAVETLATRWELDKSAAEQAKARGIPHFARAACPGARPELADALATVVRRHLVDIGIAQSNPGTLA